MNRTIFLIDGFNLYHSLKHASKDLRLGKQGTRWLDITGLCRSYLSAIGGGATLESVYYFSALAQHMQATDPDVTRRHQAYIECLKATNVTVELGRFKQKEVWCSHCGMRMIRHEEKETDVAISVKLFELCLGNQCDTAVIISGDTDIAPGIRAVQRLCGQRVGILFPYKRHNHELTLLADFSIDIKREQYRKHQLPNPYSLQDGRSISKPVQW